MRTESRKIIQVLCLITMILVLMLFLKASYNQWPMTKMGKDFTAYRASAHLLINGQNPYQAEQIFALEKSAGWTDKKPLVMFNPPWVMTYLLPFALDNYHLVKFFWFLLMFACLLICSIWLWQIYGGTDKGRIWGLVILFIYVPIYFCLAKGQIVPLILLGLAGFLHFEKQEKMFLTGIFVCLLLIKPQDTYLLLMAILFWIIQEKRWWFIVGTGCAALVTATIPALYNPDIYLQYYTDVLSHSVQYAWETPTLGYWLRALLGKEKLFLQYVPTIAAIIWFTHHWYHYRKKWFWDEQAPLLIFMSLLTTLYVWINDYVLLLVPIIQATVLVTNDSRRSCLYLIILLYLIINVMAWITAFTVQSEKWIIWMVPALLINYILVKIVLRKQM